MNQRFDAVVIGAGQAGPPLAERLGKAGKRVAVIERKLVGGTCVNTGCIPTKAMVASAYVAHMARRAHEYGVRQTQDAQVDMQRVWERTQAISGAARNGVDHWLRNMPNVTLLEGHARFESPTSVRLGDSLIEAESFFINVGGRASVPEFPGIHAVPFLTNTSMMQLRELPEHLMIIGGSYIGLEFGQMFRRFGSRVTIVERSPRLLPHEDEDVSMAVMALLQSEDITVHLGAECIALEGEAGAVRVKAQGNTVCEKALGTHVLMAVGRQPNTDDLGLDKAGIAVDARGYITVDEHCRSNVPGIWAMGDCNGKGAFTHTSYNDFEIVAADVLEQGQRRLSDRILAYSLFTDPPLARIGMTEQEARQSGREVQVGVRPMSRVGRAIERGETTGFMKVIVDGATQALLGAAIFGVNGDEAIHCLLDTMYAKAPYTAVSQAVHIHPTVAELLPTTLQSLRAV
ncbi:Pyruvate/2-oxoglutarate dehydrogenase complex, dihydrolipoamide dehydrogenase (E3) component [Dyella sp. OK004]|uniref:FAD-containing oxidoreductase n=1 Tax=Dyella sp. OK004 TaxID=1855292 RepID=UPI0008F00E2E|nr:FAD-containing oxidoreductase [Dyella sp. OK004]SFS20073.1 Pyruvate/2-oxoglutarate dehydrogenase complex, dihydrolipoamide dehydrogenase (E3) component [Dyella sp. OK004]